MESRIGNTAEYSVCGLDEGQATCLLSAVSGGLPLVEPVDATFPDPDVVSGLEHAINRAYHAWIRTQPQLILELWPDERGLDEPYAGTVRLVEPVPALLSHRTGGGLAQTHTEQGATLTRETRALLREGA